MPSTVIRAFEYFPERRELRVTFRSGKCYRYSSVPPDTYLAMKHAFAKGEFFNAQIRGRFPFTRETSWKAGIGSDEVK
jgi:hypothetical protein